MNMQRFIVMLLAPIALAACGSTGSVANTNKVHIYTAEEQSRMTEDGAIATMTTPSELREYLKNAGKVAKPTGSVSYCNAGILGQSARSDALKAVDASCGGAGQYTIVRAIPMLDAVTTFGGASCKRSEMIIFRCNGVQIKQR